MKPAKVFIYAFFTLLTVAASLTCLQGCAHKEINAKYAVKAELLPNVNTLVATTDITYTLPKSTSSLDILLYSLAFCNGAPLAGTVQGNAYGNCVMEVLSSDAEVAGTVINDDCTASIRFKNKQKMGKTLHLQIKTTTLLANTKQRLGYYDGVYNLGLFYPTVLPYLNGKYQRPQYPAFGEPFCFDKAYCTLEFTCPLTLTAVCGGNVESTKKQDGKITYVCKANSTAPITLSASKKFVMQQGDCNGTTVEYAYIKDTSPKETFAAIKNAYSLFGDLFGGDDSGKLTVVQSDFCPYGASASGLCHICGTNRSDLIASAVREIAKQWWGQKVSFNGIDEPWLGAALSQFCVALYYLKYGSENAYRQVIDDAEITVLAHTSATDKLPELTSICNLKSQNDYDAAVAKGVLMIANLCEITGREKLVENLKKFAENQSGKRTSASNFVSFIKRRSKTDTTDFFKAWLK